ncbi:Leucine-rich repeat serine/threonine-protein kinase 1 [Armadillidium nasatum]|uniref:non-specific serine/threonine protein kinase n=1 Tax=Armadillidium nasatum TaxID=96803 RepID=A0A5N5SQH6_9CRUS|nr:Leucine-rich repeat serine/threonine-protein kinase 1 [Armadillidium nasatum]
MSSSSEDSEEFPGRLLHQAALWDNAELLEDLLHGDQITHINCQDAWGRTPLHAAATTNDSKCLRILLQAGADPNIKSGSRVDGRTCLHVAAEHGAVNNISLLLAHGADLLAQDDHGLTALDIAEQAEHEPCMKLLKESADAKEIVRQELHMALREACAKGDVSRAKAILSSLDGDSESIINSAPSGSCTLLYRACEEGQKDLVRLLLEHNADGRIHPETKYSPLYIACYYGRKDIAEILLKRFPYLVSVYTVERWLPLHACTFTGHVAVLELLLRHPYPPEILRKFKDRSGNWEYEIAFDINSRDVSGQSVLYAACYAGHQKMVDILLKYRVPAKRVKRSEDVNDNSVKEESSPLSESSEDRRNSGSSETLSPSRPRIAGSIHSLMTKLNLVRGEPDNGESLISPLNVDLYCNNNSETALHVAVKNKHHNIVSLLLAAGANPNLRMYLPDDESMRQANDDYVFTGSTALVEACRNRDLGMLDLLLRNYARDDECKALFIAAQNKEELIVSKLLALKAHADPEYKVNKRSFEVKPSQQFSCLSNMSSVGVYSSLFPTVPVMINWHGQRCLSYLKHQWFIDASVNLNPKLKLSPKNQGIALYAITRLDISNNSLAHLPEMIFQLPSLRILNASQNKLEHLPVMIGQSLVDGTVTLPRKGRRNHAFPNPISVLEEIHLKDNRLVSLPEGLFLLPALQHLDVSNNKLVALPFKMWSAPKLRELNASFNLLHSLPVRPEDATHDYGNVDGSYEMSDEESISSTDQNVSFEEFSEETSSLRKTHDSKNILSLDKHGNIVTCCRTRELTHHSLWSSSVQVQESFSPTEGNECGTHSQLQSLNLSHNSFSCVPQGLACLAVNLSRLYLAYNRLSEIGTANCYPVGLKQLDLSHNCIFSWNSLLRTRRTSHSTPGSRSRGSHSSVGSLGTPPHCIHRRHTRLESLRTLVLADNQLTRLVLHMDESEFTVINEVEENDSPVRSVTPVKHRLLFPSLSMLDISNNRLRELPINLHDLTNLSVLNIAGNRDITELPPEMGLLSRLWNLNTRGCSLQEPLKSMIDSKKYKTMDVIGYLKSILEDARPYARMKLMIVGVQGIGKTSLLEQLRHEGSGSYKKKPVENGNKNKIQEQPKEQLCQLLESILVIGFMRRKFEVKVIMVPTWDFGGQKEYYATHQYFLSKRSLYLVVWNICDGEKGVEEILQWLVNIQARAPNSPVLIVGTHYDLVKEKFPPSWSEDLQQMIRNRFINVIDADKLGLPRVLDTIEVSCKTRHNVKLLCNFVYDTVFSLKTPGSKERLLEQKIPASYLALEDVIGSLAMERRAQGRDPVLPADRYQSLVTHEMANRGYKPFRDIAELNQATTFLHENGVLLHYEDVTLKDLYFLDPQWLCDMLAHVVTIREINPFVRCGLMKLEDLKHVFKSSSCAPIDAKSYIVSLLNKFEVALTWDNRTLLIPSLLPSEDQVVKGVPGMEMKIPVRSRGWSARSKKFSNLPSGGNIVGGSSTSLMAKEDNRLFRPHFNLNISHQSIGSPKRDTKDLASTLLMKRQNRPFLISHKSAPHSAIRRLLLMSYFPSGFWSRLLTRILADDAIVDIVKNYFVVPEEVVSDYDLSSLLGGQAEWSCWQTGMELHYAHTILFRLKEVLPFVGTKESHYSLKKNCPVSGEKNSCCHGGHMPDYKGMKFLIKLEGNWSDVEVKNSALLEIYLPNEAVEIRKKSLDNEETSTEADLLPQGIQSVVLDPSPECVAKLQALAVDHIDTYPTLGTRFVHTSEGKFLVTRIVPCPACLDCHGYHEGVSNHPQGPMLPENWGSFVEMNPLYCSMTGSVLSQALRGACAQRNSSNLSNEAAALPPPISPEEDKQSWGSQGSRGSRASFGSDGDSGVGPDSTFSRYKKLKNKLKYIYYQCNTKHNPNYITLLQIGSQELVVFSRSWS